MTKEMRRGEFIALMAMMTATVAFSIDAMLPALPEIGAALSPRDINRAQLVITSFVLGMGVGTFLAGPLSDTFGRKPVMLVGTGIYMLGALIAGQAGSLEVLLAARVAQGLGASGPRVVAMAVIRDRYAGRGMARIVSFVMVVFTLIPAVAPLLGSVIIDLAGWRAIFWCFIVFALVSSLWLLIRLPETLPPAKRRGFRAHLLRAAVVEMFVHPVVRLSIAVQSLVFGMLFSMLSTTQQVFDITFGRGDSFPLWFGAIAILAGTSSFLNAALVMRLGMRVMVTGMLTVQIVLSGAMVLVGLADLPEQVHFALFVFWQGSVFFMAGMTIGNLAAIAQEPMGHIAGMATSVIGGVSTVVAVFLAAPVGLMFDGTPGPLAMALTIEAIAAFALMRMMARAERRVGMLT